MAGPIFFKFEPQTQLQKLGGIVLPHDLDLKVKGQNQRSNISFCDKS